MTLAGSEADQLSNDGVSISVSDVQAMEDAFRRSEEVHKQAMTSIMSSMTAIRAVQVLQKSGLVNSELVEVENVVLGKQGDVRKQPKGYSGLDGARKLLNDMIYESMSKYDAEIAKCSDYYSRQCAALEACRGQIHQSESFVRDQWTHPVYENIR